VDAEGSVSRWLNDVKRGDAEAAGKVWQRYFTPLLAVARHKLLSGGREADEEDVVQSALADFFHQTQTKPFARLADRDDLWQLLVLITSRKASNLRRKQRRKKRGGATVRGNSVFADGPHGFDQVVGDQPGPLEATLFAEQLQNLLQTLAEQSPSLATIAVRKLEGCTNAEIAAELGCQERTVERKLRIIRSVWSVA